MALHRSTSSALYEVCVSVPETANAAYSEYMINHHIPDILRTGKFSKVTMTLMDSAVLSGGPFASSSEGMVHYKTTYEAISREALLSYLKDDAPALREDFMKHCPRGAKLQRSAWASKLQWQGSGGPALTSSL